jgi:hypothetical protein
MKAKTSIARFEGDLQGMAGNIALYRRGINEFYLSQYSWIYEQLEAVRRELEGVGMYERCRDALKQVEAWVRQGPEHDEKAESLLLQVGGELARASGSYDSSQRRFRSSNDR